MKLASILIAFVLLFVAHVAFAEKVSLAPIGGDYKEFVPENASDPGATLSKLLFGQLQMRATWIWTKVDGTRHYTYLFYQFPASHLNDVTVISDKVDGTLKWYYRITSYADEHRISDKRYVDLPQLDLKHVELDLID